MVIPSRQLIKPRTSTFNRSLVAENGRIPASMRFIQDVYPLKVIETKPVVSESISEAAGREIKALRITGIFQKADEYNQNGRLYPLGVIQEAVKAIQEDVGERGVLGEYDHPTDAKLHLDRVSHLITKLWMEGKYVYGVAEVLEDMPCGGMLATLFRNKVRVGISSRGVGDMEEVFTEGISRFQVQPGYQFVTWDVVGEPSVREATMSVMESRNRLAKQPGGLVTRANRPLVTQGQVIRELANYLNANKLQ